MDFKNYDTIEARLEGRVWTGILLSSTKLMGVIGRVYVLKNKKLFLISATVIKKYEEGNDITIKANLEIRHTRMVLTEKAFNKTILDY